MQKRPGCAERGTEMLGAGGINAAGVARKGGRKMAA
jgi:hypothetical protein